MLRTLLAAVKEYSSRLWQGNSERHKIEESLRQSEAKFRGLLETAYDSIIIVNENGNIEFANQQTKVWLGYDPRELVGKPIEVLIPERFGKSHQGHKAEYLMRPALRPMGGGLQLAVRRKDGSELPVEISLSPFKAARGTIVTVFLRDMTAQKQAENQQRFLAEASHVLSGALEYQERIQRIADVVVPQHADWCSVHIQQEGHLKLKALAQNKMLNAELVRQLAENNCLLREDSKLGVGSVAKSEVSQLIENMEGDVLQEITGGDEVCIQQIQTLNVQSLILVPMLARGRNIGVISFARCKPRSYTENDLALANVMAERAALAVDNARLYEEARSAVKLREDVLAIVSHDLKNPLGVIRGFNEILSDSLEAKGGSTIEIKSTEAIARAVRQMERLIGDLLDFAKIESGTFPLEVKPCSVERLIWEGVELVRKHAAHKGVKIRVEFQSGLPGIICDPDRIKQVLANILGNAVKFLSAYGTIEIRAGLASSGVKFTVVDNGPGISKEHLTHIFDRYWQAKETAKFGNGLGLSIVKGIIESHHGHIWVESKVGVGTTFHFTLPLTDSQLPKEPMQREIESEQLALPIQ